MLHCFLTGPVLFSELFHTERTHVRNLKVLVHLFNRPMINLNILQPNDINLLFGEWSTAIISWGRSRSFSTRVAIIHWGSLLSFIGACFRHLLEHMAITHWGRLRSFTGVCCDHLLEYVAIICWSMLRSFAGAD